MVLSWLRESVVRNLTNARASRTRRKIVVFESDDWGSIRMPSRAVYEYLLRCGVLIGSNHYDRLDALEVDDDLLGLFEVLGKYRDRFGRHPVFTFNTVLGNPDFDAIRDSSFEKYFFEDFEGSYERYVGRNFFDLWVEGIQSGVIHPQLHAREHLNVGLWMDALRRGDRLAHLGFDNGFFGVSCATSVHHSHYLAAFHPLGVLDMEQKIDIVKDSLSLFRRRFGLNSLSFIACNYVWPLELEEVLFKEGVVLLQGQRVQLTPEVSTGRISHTRHYTGQRNRLGQRYLVRNCYFEPASAPRCDWVDRCLAEIENAFLWGAPAIVSSHRVNFIGSLESKNRSENLRLLATLIRRILNRWPEVEFLSTSELVSLFDGYVWDNRVY